MSKIQGLGGNTPGLGSRAPELRAAALLGLLDAFLAKAGEELIAFRRDLHAHPELAFNEFRTTRLVADRLMAAGLEPQILSGGTGLICDIGPEGGPTIALRADLDALPLPDLKDVSYHSRIPGVAHACGHDVHTTTVLGAGLFLAELAAAGQLPGRVRLVFQPAEESLGGALAAIADGVLIGVDRVFALHCDPQTEVGYVGLREGPITASCDRVTLTLTGLGGHTARPHLTGDLVFALCMVGIDLPTFLNQRIDARSGFKLTWGMMSAGTAPNAIPSAGTMKGTLRCLDMDVRDQAAALLQKRVQSVAEGYGVNVSLEVELGLPPTINEPVSVRMLRDAATLVLGEDAVLSTPQSMGGEDFSQMVLEVPGALFRLGVCPPDSKTRLQLHQGDFDVDERSIGYGARVLAATALTALGAVDLNTGLQAG